MCEIGLSVVVVEELEQSQRNRAKYYFFVYSTDRLLEQSTSYRNAFGKKLGI